MKLIHLIETLAPIHALQELVESSKPMLHQMFHLVNIRLQAQFSAKLSDEPQLDANATLSMLSVVDASVVKADLIAFNKSLGEKWQATCARNLKDVCGFEESSGFGSFSKTFTCSHRILCHIRISLSLLMVILP